MYKIAESLYCTPENNTVLAILLLKTETNGNAKEIATTY